MNGGLGWASKQRIFQIMNLQPTDIFIDLGHGIGNATLQAAYTRGCESRGIEMLQDRCFIADRFKERLAEIKHLLHEERDYDVSHFKVCYYIMFYVDHLNLFKIQQQHHNKKRFIRFVRLEQ